MSAADELRALTDAATPGPWRESGGYVWSNEHPARVALACSDADAELIVWLVNHAQAIADLWDDNARLRAAIGTACTDLEGIDDHVADALLAALEADT